MSTPASSRRPVTPGAIPITARRDFHTVVVPFSDGRHNFREKFVVDKRYVDLQYVGGGAYGIVVKAQDEESGAAVAIKKIPDVFSSRSLNDSKRILRELILLRHLGGHENVAWIQDIMVYPNKRDFRDVYIVSGLMEGDLGGVVSSSQTLSDAQMKYFVYQLLRGLKYVHTAGVLHRDLKPQNVLVNSDCSLKITDFGLGRAVDEDMMDQEMTPYVVTRWYRAPELLLDFRTYGPSVDMWSVGCILAELLGRRPLFCGKNFAEQLKIIITVLGTPEEEDLSFVTNDELLKLLRSWRKKPKVAFSHLYPRANPQAIDLLEKLLVFDPRQRISIEEALEHPYVAEFRHPDTEVSAPRRVVMDFEGKGKMSRRELQGRMLREMAYFHPECNEQLRLSGSDGLVLAGQTGGVDPGTGQGGGEVGGAGGAGTGAGGAGAGAGAAYADLASDAEGLAALAAIQAEEAERLRKEEYRRDRAQAGLAALGAESDGASNAALTATVTAVVQQQMTVLWAKMNQRMDDKLSALEARMDERLKRAEGAIAALARRMQRTNARQVRERAGAGPSPGGGGGGRGVVGGVGTGHGALNGTPAAPASAAAAVAAGVNGGFGLAAAPSPGARPRSGRMRAGGLVSPGGGGGGGGGVDHRSPAHEAHMAVRRWQAQQRPASASASASGAGGSQAAGASPAHAFRAHPVASVRSSHSARSSPSTSSGGAGGGGGPESVGSGGSGGHAHAHRDGRSRWAARRGSGGPAGSSAAGSAGVGVAAVSMSGQGAGAESPSVPPPPQLGTTPRSTSRDGSHGGGMMHGHGVAPGR